MPEKERNANFIKHVPSETAQKNARNKKKTYNKNRYTATANTLLSVATQRKRRCVNGENESRKSFPVANGSISSMLDWVKASELDDKQEHAFLSLVSTFVLTYYEDAKSQNADPHSIRPRRLRHELNKQIKLLKTVNARKQLILFLTGAAGSGKSQVIKEVLIYCQEYCEQIKVPFTDRTIVVTALTGVAAVLIHGETLHSATHVFNKKITQEMIERWRDARLVIVDEISFANKDLLEAVDQRIGELRENIYERFGGVSIAFMGDFRQLEPIQNTPIYRDRSTAIWYDTINCFIELETNHRAKDDPEYAALLKRFRDGEPTQEDIDTINSRMVDPTTVPPQNIQYASPTNKDRCAINNAVFLKHLESTHSKNPEDEIPKHTILIGSDNLCLGSTQKKTLKPFRFPKLFYEQCSEADCKKSNNSRIDPLLKLFSGGPVMLILNVDVKEGEANGCSCFVKEIFLKENITLQRRCIDGYWVNFVAARDVAYIHVSPEQYPEKVFVLTPQKHSVRVHFPQPKCLSMDDDARIYIRMNITQFSININHATTGHKLQGKSLDELFISSWSYTRNWPYVLLSRVRTLKGLFTRQKLKRGTGKDSKDYSMPIELKNMMATFRTNKRPTVFDDFDPEDLRSQCRALQEAFTR